MKALARVLAAIGLLSPPAHALGHAKQIKAIQNYCNELDSEFAGASPDVFSGPDPWTELEEVPASMQDQALALVYSEGKQPRWVFLRIKGPEEDAWWEDINYYFRADGTIAKRERHFQIRAANITLSETTFYDHGKVIKDRTHHQALGPGKKNTSAFIDEPAPDYMTVDDLPFRDDSDTPARLVNSRQRLVQIPDKVFQVF
jgi:hypothetical protein